MTQKPKDDLGKNGIELLRIYSHLTYNALRQQTAQEIFNDIDYQLKAPYEDWDIKIYNKIKQKYLGEKE